MAYVAQIDNATSLDVEGLKWIKIFEDGLDDSGTWGVTRMIAADGKVNFTMPSCLPDGDYLLRAELIALHGASSYPGAQL
jgi:cellulase